MLMLIVNNTKIDNFIKFSIGRRTYASWTKQKTSFYRIFTFFRIIISIFISVP